MLMSVLFVMAAGAAAVDDAETAPISELFSQHLGSIAKKSRLLEPSASKALVARTHGASSAPIVEALAEVFCASNTNLGVSRVMFKRKRSSYLVGEQAVLGEKAMIFRDAFLKEHGRLRGWMGQFLSDEWGLGRALIDI